jgi:uncharacterized membrane protein YdbT with pleckstrin-like domain
MLVVPLAWSLLSLGAIAATWLLAPDNSIFDWVVTAVAVAVLIRFGLYRFVAWWFTWFVLTDERLITRSGILARKGVEIPLENINDVRFSQNVLERALRSGDLLIESAGEQGQSRFHDIPRPEEFQSLLYRVREDRSVALTRGPAAPPSTTDQETPMSRLERLGKLFRDGLITAEEYEAKKQALLDEM